MGDVHSRALKGAGIEIAGIVSSTPEKSQQAASSLGINRAYRSVEELLADSSVTVVHVLTPNESHAKYVSMALDAGKHVVCEKPLTVDAAEAIALTKRAQELNLIGAIPFAYRFHAMTREARSKVLAGELGKLFSVRGQYLQDWLLSPEDTNWRVDASLGGPSRAFADIGIHLCDLVEFISGKRIERLVEAGVTEEQLLRLMSPIGLDIGARTPEETAISICGEIIARRTGRGAPSLRDGDGPIHK